MTAAIANDLFYTVSMFPQTIVTIEQLISYSQTGSHHLARWYMLTSNRALCLRQTHSKYFLICGPFYPEVPTPALVSIQGPTWILYSYLFFSCLCFPIINQEAKGYCSGSKVVGVGGTIRKALGRVDRAWKLKTENHIWILDSNFKQCRLKTGPPFPHLPEEYHNISIQNFEMLVK